MVVDELTGERDVSVEVLGWGVGAEVVVFGEVVEVGRGGFRGDGVHHRGGGIGGRGC